MARRVIEEAWPIRETWSEKKEPSGGETGGLILSMLKGDVLSRMLLWRFMPA